MANGTSGHESEFINVQDLKAALQKFKTDKVDVKVNTSTTVNGHALSSNVTVTKSDVGLGSVGNFKAVSTVASQGLTNTEKSNARANIGAGTSSFSGSYNDLTNKPSIPAAVAVKGNAETSYRTGNVNITPTNIGLGNVGNFKAVSTVASQGLSATEKSNARANIGAGTSSFSGSYSDLSNKPTIPSVVQTTGNSTTSVMSQKAVSDLIPAQASSSNQLADKAFVNSSITTATATYQGSYNLVSDLSLTTQASHGQIEQALNTAATGADNNDYSFVQIPTADSTPTEIASVERYKYNGTTWSYEYAINNSGFTAAQWASVNSNITSGLVAQLNAFSNNPQTSISKLFGMDANGNFQNISTSDFASVLNGLLTNFCRTTSFGNSIGLSFEYGGQSVQVDFGIGGSVRYRYNTGSEWGSWMWIKEPQ